eukprot:TRINITY_DN9580_c0_g2_i2.p1 TRINITY_DN9580_c0_g2~~TRINITY_DN9580_c0_g2_i2.p1  ORF type:complete len:879 (+),score=231.80 TRINITY_DN9580_c0_g2_i2:229-2637(+)
MSHQDMLYTWLYDIRGNSWQVMANTTRAPPPRSHAQAQGIGPETLVLHGGVYLDVSGAWIFLDDVWTLNINSGVWTELSCTSKPLALAGAASVYRPEFGFMVTGGKAATFPSVFHVASFNLVSRNWTTLLSSSVIGARWGHAAALLPDPRTSKPTLFVTGGRNALGLCNDMWEIDLSTMAVKAVPVTATSHSMPQSITSSSNVDPVLTDCDDDKELFNPNQRVFAAFTTLPYSSKLVVTGGAMRASQVLQEDSLTRAELACFTDAVWVFDVHTRNWTRVRAPDWLIPRIEHDIVSLNGTSLLLVAGGGRDSYLADTTFMNLGCNPGTAALDYLQEACVPCPLGTYADQPGMQACTRTCGDKVTTRSEGSDSPEDCNVCTPDACHGHGRCTVNSEGQHQCQCHWAYTLSEDCQHPIQLYIIGGACFLMFVIGLSARRVTWSLRRLRRDRKHVYTLLEERDEEIQSMSRDWLIHSNELTLKRRIDKGSEGTFAAVYLAQWQSEQVAVKRLKEQIQAMSIFNASLATDFEREIRILRRTRHRNVVLFYGAGEFPGVDDAPGAPFLVIEYCERGSLRSLINNNDPGLTFARAIQLAIDASKGMRFLHGLSPPQVHRDIKSANLLITESWVCKVADLGTARLISELNDVGDGLRVLQSEVEDGFLLIQNEEQLAQASSAEGDRHMTKLVGTYPWMAPEVRQGQYGTACDIYSFGVVLWELAMRRLPYADRAWHPNELMKQVEQGYRPNPLPDVNQVGRHFVDLMQECWHSNPSARPRFEDVVKRLQHIYQAQAVVHQVASPPRAGLI